jgi:hypothetical protein
MAARHRSKNRLLNTGKELILKGDPSGIFFLYEGKAKSISNGETIKNS